MIHSRSAMRHSLAVLPSKSDGAAFLLGRAYLNYQTVLQSLLEAEGLDEHFRPGQGSILFSLFEGDGASMSELAARTSLAASSVTQVISQMERSGLVKRKRDVNDGRAVRVHLTPLARRLEPRCRALNERVHELLQAGLSPREASELRRLLAAVVTNLHGYFTDRSGQ
jgi:DNA-binding MarR family transcriptional regulator